MLLYNICPPKARIWYLILLSCGFSALFDISLPVYLALYALINYLIGISLPDSKNRIFLFRLGIVLNLTQLAFLRYATFAVDPILDLINSNLKISFLSNIIVPIGISYYTLQGIGYLVNVKMGWEKPEKSFLRFFLYIIYFPKFLSGPIERSNHFLPQCDLSSACNLTMVTSGLRTALLGFFKKIIIANPLGYTVTQLYTCPEDFVGYQVVLIILLQPLYLYFDFSGYTDIAIGLSRAIGIELSPNFNKPFLAENMTTFWRRFHISLSSWFNDYVFKQTSFRLRKLKGHATVIAIFLTWILFGIWHGAGWNFMVLGLLQAAAIYYEYRTRKIRSRLFSFFPGYSRKLAGRAVTFSFYALSLTFFFAPDLPMSLRVISEIFHSQGTTGSHIPGFSFLCGLSLALLSLLFEVLMNDFYPVYSRFQMIWQHNRLVRIIVYYATIVIILMQIDNAGSFIYAMF